MKNGSLCVATGHLLVKICLILDPLLIIHFQVATRSLLLVISTFQISLGTTTHTTLGYYPYINWIIRSKLLLYMDDYFMTQLCLTPTRESNILDLLITNPPEQIWSLDICDPTEIRMTTDHKVIRFTCCETSNTIMSTTTNAGILMTYENAY